MYKFNGLVLGIKEMVLSYFLRKNYFIAQYDKFLIIIFMQFRNVEKDKYEVIGTIPGVTSSADEDQDGPVTNRPNRFRPKAGIRERLRTNLQENLEREKTYEDKEYDEFDNDDSSESFTLRPPKIK